MWEATQKKTLVAWFQLHERTWKGKSIKFIRGHLGLEVEPGNDYNRAGDGDGNDLKLDHGKRSVLGVHWKDWCWSWNSNTLATWCKSWLIGKDPDAGKDWGQEEKGTKEDEMVGWHHWLNGHGFGWTPGVGDGQGGLACCSSWGHKESDTTEWLNWTELNGCTTLHTY